MKKILILLIFIVVLTISGCLIPTSNISLASGVDLSQIKSIAVLDFKKGGKLPNSSDIVKRALEISLEKKGYIIVHYSKIKHIVDSAGGGTEFSSDILTTSLLKKFKDEAGVDAVAVGSILDAWCDPKWMPSCWIELTAQIIGTDSGSVILSANISDEGWSFQEAAQVAADKILEKL